MNDEKDIDATPRGTEDWPLWKKKAVAAMFGFTVEEPKQQLVRVTLLRITPGGDRWLRHHVYFHHVESAEKYIDEQIRKGSKDISMTVWNLVYEKEYENGFTGSHGPDG